MTQTLQPHHHRAKPHVWTKLACNEHAVRPLPVCQHCCSICAVSAFVRKQLVAMFVPDKHVGPVTQALLDSGMTTWELLRRALQHPSVTALIEASRCAPHVIV